MIESVMETLNNTIVVLQHINNTFTHSVSLLFDIIPDLYNMTVGVQETFNSTVNIFINEIERNIADTVNSKLANIENTLVENVKNETMSIFLEYNDEFINIVSETKLFFTTMGSVKQILQYVTMQNIVIMLVIYHFYCLLITYTFYNIFKYCQKLWIINVSSDSKKILPYQK